MPEISEARKTKKSVRFLRLLGPILVERGQYKHGEINESATRTLPRFRSKRTLGLLAFLVAEQRPVSRDILASLFWPDETTSKGRANLSRELHNLAQILPNSWQLDRRTVAFMPSVETAVDLYQLQEMKEQERWVEAADLLAGEFAEGLYLEDNPEFENWLLIERERWRGFAKEALKHVVDSHTLRGRYNEALQHLQRLLQLAPWEEETHQKTMCLLAWTGKRGAALRQFKVCKQVLREELGIDPAVETVELYQQIQSGKLALPPQLPTFLTDEKPRKEYTRPIFVGRESELTKLGGYMNEAFYGQGKVIFITGEPGQGKTALLESFAQQMLDLHPNLLVAGGKCNAYAGVGDPYLPYRDVMAMLTGDIEGRWDAGAISRKHARRLWSAFSLIIQTLLDHGPNLLDVLVPGEALLSRSLTVGQDYAPWLPRLREQVKRNLANKEEVEQGFLFQQITNVLVTIAQERPLLLILDDIQWADAASISLLFHLGRHLADIDNRLLIVCAYRPEEVAFGRNGQRHPLAKILNELKRTFGDVWVDLAQTEKTKNRRFVDALLDIEPNRLEKRFRDALFTRTEGHPLFTIELLRAMRDRGELIKEKDGTWIEGPTLDWQILPSRVEAVIEERINRLNPELRNILTIASVEGEMFTAQVVADVLKIPERTVLNWLSIDLEKQHNLVREQEEVETNQRRLSRYRFSHILYQDYLYKQQAPGTRRLIHEDIANALVKLYDQMLDGMAVELAQHYQQAGNHSKAFNYYFLAGKHADRLFESRDAIAHYSHAIQQAESFSPEAISLAKSYRGRGLAYSRLGEFERAHSDHHMILHIAEAAGERQAAYRANLDLGRLWASRDYNEARGYFKMSLAIAHDIDNSAFLADGLNWMGNWYANAENPNRAITQHQKALDIFENLGTQQEIANTLDLLALANLLACNLNNSVQFYNQAIALFQRLDNQPRLLSSLIGRATTVSALAWLTAVPPYPPPDAYLDFKKALRITGKIGSIIDQAWAYYSLAMLHTVRGCLGQALGEAENSLRIASEIEHREYQVGARYALGLVYSELFATDMAQRQLETALTMAQELRSPTWINVVSGALAGLRLMQNDPKSAQVCLEAAVSTETPMDSLGKRYCWVRWAEIALAQDNPALALNITERLIATAPGISQGQVIPYLWKLKAESLMALANFDDLSEENTYILLQAAIKNAQETDQRFLLWRLHADLTRYYQMIGQLEKAEKEYMITQALIDEVAETILDDALKMKFFRGTNSILGLIP
jgi:adenylate cyclase